MLRHNREDGSFSPIYWNDTDGIGGWDFSQFADRALAYDYDHSGRMDHVICYRPGCGGIYILKHDGMGTFNPVFKEAPVATRRLRKGWQGFGFVVTFAIASFTPSKAPSTGF